MPAKNTRNMRMPGLAEIKEAFLKATSTDIDSGGKTQVVLYWKPVRGAIGYNIYRTGRRTTPINGSKPIRQVDTCPGLEAIIPRGSKEWKMLVDAFSSVVSRSSLVMVPDRLGRARIKDVSDLFARHLISPGTDLQALRPKLKGATLDPCEIVQRGLTDKEQALFDSLAVANLKIRRARGWATIDSNVTAGTTYTYELRGVFEGGREIVLDRDVTIKAGHFVLPNHPSGFDLLGGDSQILALWNRNNSAFSYMLQRYDSVSGQYRTINDSPIIYDVDIPPELHNRVSGDPRPGFVDYQRWNSEGLPVSHNVNGFDFDGPRNGTTYYYRVASCDILGRHSNWSSPKDEMPVNATPPMAPTDLRVDVNDSPFCLALTWRKVTRNERNHQILDTTQTYKIYRADTSDALDDLAALSSFQIGTKTANPTDPGTVTLSWLDTDPNLRVPYGEKDFWYRVACVDTQGNESAPSAAISGRLPDITPPGRTVVTGGDGYADHISVYWLPNSEPDLAGYQVYRGICNNGEPYRPSNRGPKPDSYSPCDFTLVGEVSLAEAVVRMADTGRIFFDDFSVPPDSPLCYSYWIRAYDFSGNLYQGSNVGCPMEPDEYTCQRLLEETPPPVPIITTLKARDRAVLIEWTASPLQDLRAFHIYRSEKELDAPVFIGCMLTNGTLYSGRWQGQRPSCGEIPAEVDPATVHGSFVDKTVKANNIYWYRVSALDWLGNESEGDDLLRIPAISTFTYSKELTGTPVVSPPAGTSSQGCGLVVSWSPAFTPGEQKGFLVFRSAEQFGNYRQVSNLVQTNSFEDLSAIHGKDYWYRVQVMAPDGNLSRPSAPVKYSY